MAHIEGSKLTVKSIVSTNGKTRIHIELPTVDLVGEKADLEEITAEGFRGSFVLEGQVDQTVLNFDGKQGAPAGEQ